MKAYLFINVFIMLYTQTISEVVLLFLMLEPDTTLVTSLTFLRVAFMSWSLASIFD